MCLPSSFALHFVPVLNEALRLAELDLKLVAVSPTYVSTVLPQVTTAWYMMSFVWHSPSRGARCASRATAFLLGFDVFV